MPKKIEVIISGFGGQGVVLAGKILGRAAAYEGKYVVQTQSYGAEARGSTTKSEVIISDSKIDFPKVRRCDILVTMSQNALETHLEHLKENGVLIVDKDKIPHLPETKARVFKIPATKTAAKLLKSRLYTNVIMLGALSKITGIVKEKAVEKAITDSVPEDVREANIRGFRKGLKLVVI
ncbi:MAG: 2-oxoacid:acceptor oxidoreductase family protein [Candidatus Bathyarchaeota archaeon]|nr:2-oxoacid:acceptor oxidoreductase family protein [Candidatus Bathyarchaeota archaeon]